MEAFFLIIFLLFLVCELIRAYFYKKTDYYKVTHNSYLSTTTDKGLYGEYQLYKALRCYENQGAKFLYNCYLPKKGGGTTEVDLIMICSKGIFVFENKNYSGWIFGTEDSKTWTQTLPNGRKSRKEHFYNPVMQNENHIRWLKNQVGDWIPVHSLIVFSDRCTLKDITITTPEIFVVNKRDIHYALGSIVNGIGTNIPDVTIDNIYNTLYPYTQTTSEQKAQHIQNIHRKPTYTVNSNIVPSHFSSSNLICPRCGSSLVLRTAKKGKNVGKDFFGCSNYPKCRYTRQK